LAQQAQAGNVVPLRGGGGPQGPPSGMSFNPNVAQMPTGSALAGESAEGGAANEALG
jgi:hypothetical protein